MIRRRARLLLGLTLLTLAGAGGAAAQPAPGTAAPEITAGKWINSAPLAMGGLRGRVVAVEFWTFG